LAFVGFVNALTRKVVHHLSSVSGLPEVHLDDLIQHELGASSHEILTHRGVREWREAENSMLAKAISLSPPSILSLGEGAVDQYDDLNVVLDWTQLIYLHLPVEEAVRQASRQNAVQGAILWAEVQSREGLWDEDIRSLYEERAFNYRTAHHVIELSNRKIRDVTSEILAMIPNLDAVRALAG
jgi:shikimate kinase